MWKLGVLVMCLGVRSPSGGEAGREEGVIHKLGPGVLGSVSRVEKAAGRCCAARDSCGVAVTGPGGKHTNPSPPHPPPADVLPQRDFQEDQRRRFQPYMCVCSPGWGMFKTPKVTKKPGLCGNPIYFHCT